METLGIQIKKLLFFCFFLTPSLWATASTLCSSHLQGFNTSTITEYYQLKREFDPEAVLDTLDNKNLAGTFHRLIPALTADARYFPLFKTADEVALNLQKVFEIPMGLNFYLGRGVRALLKQALEKLRDQGYQAVLPDDVYPAYEMIAQDAGMALRKFSTIPSLFIPKTLTKKEVLVITSPLSPQGRELSAQEISLLEIWLNQDVHRRLILDTVYTFDRRFDLATLALLKNPQTIAIHSFAKAFLVPGHLGFSVGNSKTLDELGLVGEPSLNFELASRALWIANQNPSLPAELQATFQGRWAVLASQLEKLVPGWKPPANGYFSVIPRKASETLEAQGAWSFPLSVYGSSNQEVSIISCLPNSKEKVFYVTVLSNFARGFDKYSMTYSKGGVSESSFPDKFFLLTAPEIPIGL